MVHPTEARRNAPLPLRSQEMFFNHNGVEFVVSGFSGPTKPRMFLPRSNSWRAVAAISSCNVLPVTIEISPTNAGAWVRHSSCNVRGSSLGTLQDE